MYSTCTYNPQENEENAAWFAREFPEFHPEGFSLPGIDAPDGIYTCYPHRTKGEGQFTALLKKKGNSECPFIPDTSLPKAGSKDAARFADSFPGLPNATHIFGHTLIHTEFLPDIKGISVYRIGLHLGEIHDSYFIPDHASAYIAASSIQKSIVDPEHALRYMAGETVDGNESVSFIGGKRRSPRVSPGVSPFLFCLSVSGRTQLAAYTLSPLIMTAPSWSGDPS